MIPCTDMGMKIIHKAKAILQDVRHTSEATLAADTPQTAKAVTYDPWMGAEAASAVATAAGAAEGCVLRPQHGQQRRRRRGGD